MKIRGSSPMPEEYWRSDRGLLGPVGDGSDDWYRTPEAHVRYLLLCAKWWSHKSTAQAQRVRKRAVALAREWGVMASLG
jgi:hypothetical protein